MKYCNICQKDLSVICELKDHVCDEACNHPTLWSCSGCGSKYESPFISFPMMIDGVVCSSLNTCLKCGTNRINDIPNTEHTCVPECDHGKLFKCDQCGNTIEMKIDRQFSCDKCEDVFMINILEDTVIPCTFCGKGSVLTPEDEKLISNFLESKNVEYTAIKNAGLL